MAKGRGPKKRRDFRDGMKEEDCNGNNSSLERAVAVPQLDSRRKG